MQKPLKALNFQSPNCFMGDEDYLIYAIKEAFNNKIKSIDINVSFLMESGVWLLQPELKKAAEMDIPVRILTGNYLNITQPQALYLIKDIMEDKVDIRFYNVPNKSFHPKAYIFEYENDGEMFIGSSNMSRSALTNGIEWNYRILKSESPEDFFAFKERFEYLFLNYSTIIDEIELKKYSMQWKKPKLYKYKSLENENEKDISQNTNIIYYPKPRGAQIEALYELRKTREEGLDKGLVVAATGVGKTYIAAFDSKNFRKILFIAHREEILKQAEKSFKNVHKNCKIGFFTGNKKDEKCDILLATVQTMGQSRYLCKKYFKPEDFEYIIIDEFHHAVAKSYKKILEYFKPQFLLGLTATPERLDNKNVYALCDYNVVYEIDLKTAINRGLLVPFRYYGIYDDVDYEKIEYKHGKYNEKQLEQALMINKRAELIFNHYNKYKTKRALGFCSSKSHAEYMAKYFINKGIKAYAVHSGEKNQYVLDREEAVSKLSQGKIKVIFSVDMFNEGLDIPSIDLVMFLRPTESPTIFLQQLGRGLRKCKNKEYLNVLDFIGNFKNANLIPSLLSINNIKNYNKNKLKNIEDYEYPEDCIVDFDFRIIDIFKKQEEARIKIKEKILDEFYRIKDQLGHRPSRVEMFENIHENLYQIIKRNTKNNIFKNYLGFLNSINELTKSEKELLGTKGMDFISMVENTSMTKTYKMPLLLAFIDNDKLKMKVDQKDIYISFKTFYSKPSNGIDLSRHKETANYKNWSKKKYWQLAKNNPIKYLLKAEPNFFYMENDKFCISNDMKPFCDNEAFINHFLDSTMFRIQEFYKNRFEKNNIL